MAEAQKYVAIENFSLNLDNGKSQIDVKKGEELTFDGLHVTCRGEHGQARSLSKVIGEWIKPADSRAAHPVTPQASLRSLNATSNRVEQSDPSPQVDQNEDSNAELRRLINQYENTPASTHISERTTDDMADMRKEAKAQVKIEDQDAQDIAISSDKSSAVKNTAGVKIDRRTPKKAPVVSHEERVAKKSNYGKKPAEPLERKKLKVDKDGSGVEVRKVKTSSIYKNEVKTFTIGSSREVSAEEDAVLETNYGTEMGGDVGSSTQAKLEKDAIMKKPVAAVDRSNKEVIAEASYDGVVVSKVSKIPEDGMTTREGITSRVTVSSGGGMDDGEVEFSSNSEINEGKATFHKTNDVAVDLSGGGMDDSDIDVNDILDNV